MSLQLYSQNYAKYHGATYFNSKNDGTISIPLIEESNVRHIVMKAKTLPCTWMECDRPLVKSLSIYYKIQSLATVLYNDTTWGLLLGNHKIIYPQKEGQNSLTITPFFVPKKCVTNFHHFMTMQLKAIPSYDNTYLYNNVVLYLDPYEIIYPGGSYFDTIQTPDDLYRICYLGHGDVMNEIILEKYLVLNLPFKTKSIETNISNFINLNSPRQIPIPNVYHTNTNVIRKHKCNRNPRFIIQDILDTYGNYRNIGIMIESPILISHEYENHDSNNRKFHTIAINCVLPKKYLYVPRPYDRYYEYDTVPKHLLQWTTVLYDREDMIPMMDTVIWDYNIIGFSYRDTFFCLADVKLCTSTIIKYQNLDKIFGKLTFNLKDCPDIIVLNSFPFGGNYTLHCIKFTSLRYELWCISEDEENSNYIKKHSFPSLVSNWVNFILNVTKHEDFGDLSLVKLLYVLSKHKICFSLEVGETDMKFISNKDILFYIDRPLTKFINKMRWQEEETQEESCIIL